MSESEISIIPDKVSVEDRLQLMNQSFERFEGVLEQVNGLANTTTTFMAIHKDIKKMEQEIKILMKQSEDRLEEFRLKARMIEPQLNNISGRLDKMLDKALSMDIENGDLETIKFRSHLLEQVNMWSENITKILFTLLKN